MRDSKTSSNNELALCSKSGNFGLLKKIPKRTKRPQRKWQYCNMHNGMGAQHSVFETRSSKICSKNKRNKHRLHSKKASGTSSLFRSSRRLSTTTCATHHDRPTSTARAGALMFHHPAWVEHQTGVSRSTPTVHPC